jgi:hypothetical protein
MISALAVFRWLWFRQDSDLFESTRRNTYLLLHFSNEGVTGRFVTLAMSTDDVPDSGIEEPLRRASGEEHLVSPNQQPTRADPHGLARRSVLPALYI